MTQETVGSIGEFGLIDRIRNALPPEVIAHESLTVGIGDDTAVWQPTPGEQVLFTTDALVEGIHFDLRWQDWETLGWKSLAVNLSDIAAMGGRPAVATISLGLRADTALDDVLSFYEGAARLAAASAVLIAGGDIVRSPDAVTIAVTVLGETRDGRYLSRSGAQPGDLIAVSGTLGAAAAGLKLLGLPEDDPRRNSATAPALIDGLLEPRPHVELGELLLQSGASAAMDLSDGLLGDLPKILEASEVAAIVRAPDIPVASSLRALFPDEWQALALHGGEDYEILFTATEDAFQEITGPANDFDQMVTVIGEVQSFQKGEPLLTLLNADNQPIDSGGGAFDHFRTPESR